MAGSLGVVGSVVGISSGLNSLFGGGSSGNAKTGSSTLADPFANYRPAFAQQLYNLYQNPSSITTTPGYQFGLQSGMNTLQANQAKQGNLVSGGALQQAQQYGQQYGLSQFSNMASQLGQLAGATQLPSAGQTAASNIASTNLANQLGSTNTVLSGLGSLYNQLGGGTTAGINYGSDLSALTGSGGFVGGNALVGTGLSASDAAELGLF